MLPGVPEEGLARLRMRTHAKHCGLCTLPNPATSLRNLLPNGLHLTDSLRLVMVFACIESKTRGYRGDRGVHFDRDRFDTRSPRDQGIEAFNLMLYHGGASTDEPSHKEAGKQQDCGHRPRSSTKRFFSEKNSSLFSYREYN